MVSECEKFRFATTGRGIPSTGVCATDVGCGIWIRVLVTVFRSIATPGRLFQNCAPNAVRRSPRSAKAGIETPRIGTELIFYICSAGKHLTEPVLKRRNCRCVPSDPVFAFTKVAFVTFTKFIELADGSTISIWT